MKNKVKYGLLSYSSMNIGDEIQSIAALRFLPRVDVLIHREKVNSFNSEDKTKLIMNAWWMWKPENFPPSKSIIPLPISMYFRDEIRESLNQDSLEFLKNNGPIGCRDISTRDFLLSKGIDAFFSGCLTLTLEKNKDISPADFILAIDLPNDVVSLMRRKTTRPIYTLTQILSPSFTQNQRYDLAKIVLYLLSKAHCVVTTRLHVALPCLALETPILRLDLSDDDNNIKSRFSGYDGCFHVAHQDMGPDIFMNFDLNNPPDNPKKYLAIRESLIDKVKAFTGFETDKPCFQYKSDEDALIKLLQNLKYDKRVMKKNIWWMSNKDLIRTWLKKVFLGKTKHNR